MPVLDWARTELEYPNPDGTSNLYFNRAEFAYFDIHILKREGARDDYDASTLERMEEEVAPGMNEEAEKRLVDNIIVKTQGFVNGNISENDFDPVGKFRDLLKLYEGIDADKLRENMAYFLNAIMLRYAMNTTSICVSIPTIPRCRFLDCRASSHATRIYANSSMPFPIRTMA